MRGFFDNQSLFFENALPEGVFKYSSNSMALCRSEKAVAVLICQVKPANGEHSP